MKGTIQPDWNNKVDLSTQGIAEVFNTLDTSGGFSLSDEIPVNISGTPYKITGQTLANIVGGGGAQQAGLTNYIKNCGTISSLPTTLTDSNITSDMIVLEATLGTPSVLTSDLTVTTANGSVTISGSISGSTTLTIVFGVGYTVAPTILTNLGSSTPDNILKADPRPGVTGVLPVANGGTNSSTVAGARTNLDVYSKSETNNAIQQSTASSEVYVVYGTYCTVQKKAGVVYVYGNSSGGLSLTGDADWHALTTIPSGYRPANTVYFAGSSAAGKGISFRINTSGLLEYVAGTGNTTSYWSYGASYISD